MRATGVMRAGVVGLIAGVSSCNQIADIREGTLIEAACAAVEDCVVEVPECRTAVACEGGACVFEGAIDGTPLAEQTPGDCAALVCDGDGGARVQPSEDPEDDENICTNDTCIDGATAHQSLDTASCYTGPPGTQGIGSCHGGTQQCMNGVPVGGCIGEVNPGPESCDAGEADEDCDGEVNEAGPNCVCADGYLSAGENCDDGNTDDCDGCRGDCSAVETGCGDGFLCGGESCDDGGTSDGDSCSPTCQMREVLQVATGHLHTCALLTGGVVKCWGENGVGRLGLGDIDDRGDEPNEMGDKLPAVSLGTGKTALAITAGADHTCALLNDHSVKCWGRNDYGQLGLGDIDDRGDESNEMGDDLLEVDLGPSKTALAITAGAHHTCALLDDHSVKCWGLNNSGRLGLGDIDNRGDGPNEMGDNLPEVDLGPGKTALAIDAGASHTCVLLDDASVKCWGQNHKGQLGLGNTVYHGNGPNEMGDNLPEVDLGTDKTAVAITAGDLHSCARLNDASVKCWGQNASGELGLGDIDNRGDELNEMGDNLPEVDLGMDKTAVAITAGAGHTCAILNNASVKCWGLNASGQLGLGNTESRGDGENEMGDVLPAVSLGMGKTALAISAGDGHTCAVLNDTSVICWGGNSSGQLGLGDTATRGDGPKELDWADRL